MVPPLMAEERLEAERSKPQALFYVDRKSVTRADGSTVLTGHFLTWTS